MYNRKPSLWVITSIALLIFGGLALLPGAIARPASAQSPLAPDIVADKNGASGFQLATADDYQGTPTSITKDEEGYTIWTYDNWRDGESTCWMFSRLRWPFDLGAQDPTELSETALIFTFAEKIYVTVDGDPIYTDPTWAVALNGNPAGWVDGSFTGEWNVIGSIGTTPTRIWETVMVEQEVSFDYTELIDGENNIYFQQQDFGYCTGLLDCACTCYDLMSIKLRARVKLGIKEVSPEPDARNVSVRQSLPPEAYSLHAEATTDSEIRVRFTTIVSENTVNEQTFQVYYLDDSQQPVYVAGQPHRLSDVEYVFVPDAPLRDGIRYQVSVWGETDALAENHGEWVQDLSGGPLEIGRHWSFWTLPQLRVRLEPVQVLEDEKLIVGKPTALRVYLSSANMHTDVWYKDLWEYVDVEDIQFTWGSPSGSYPGAISWRAGGADWHFAYTPETARRYRLNDKSAKIASQDSVNYYGFIPEEAGLYSIRVAVTVLDSRGEPQRFVDLVTQEAVQTRWLNIHLRALAVGSDYGKTGVDDLRWAVPGHRRGVQALYPVPNVWVSHSAQAVPFYSHALVTDNSAPAGDLLLRLMLLEVSSLCVLSSNCDFMVGYAPVSWLADNGLTLPSIAPYSALVQNQYGDIYRFLVAHEGGHLYGFEHDTYMGGEGYDVQRRQDRRFSTTLMPPANSIYSFMNVDPYIESPDKLLWIEWRNYRALMTQLTTSSQALQHTATSDPLLLATGLITPTSGDVTLNPWYQLEPGEWQEPTPGPYQLMFLDSAGAEIMGYTRSFTASGALQPASGPERQASDNEPSPFLLKVPYPAATARIQIRRSTDQELLAERVLSANPPSVSIVPPANDTWTGAQSITWQIGATGTHHSAVLLSLDNGATWQAQAIHLTGTTFTIETSGLPNSAQALVRVLATDGLNTAGDTAGPFAINNPVGVDYVSPMSGTIDVNVDQPLYAGFREAMDPTTIHSATFTLSGGPYGTVPVLIRYDDESREATFIPQTRLAYSTTYTAHVSTAIQTLDGAPLDAGATWSFTTEADFTPPRARLLSPPHGALDVPLNTIVAVAWDRAIDATTLTTMTFQMAEMRGDPISGSVAYDAATHTATLTPGTLLTPHTTYVVTLTAGISDTLGNATFDPIVWAFTTGDTHPALALTGSYADWGEDTDGDGLYEHLVIRVGVQVTTTGSYVLRGTLADVTDEQIAPANITATLTAGAHFLDLAFDGTSIGGRGADGPYTLTELMLHPVVTSQTTTLTSTAQQDAYRTFAYPANHFPAPLRFGDLPDVLLLPGTTVLNAFNVRTYAQHITRTSDQLSYTVMLNTNPKMGVDLQTSGAVYLTPEAYWQGRTLITVRVSDGVYAVQDTFEAAVGWPHTIYLPVVLRSYGSAVLRNAWITKFTDDFEGDSIGWQITSWTYKEGDPPPEGFGWYTWDLSDCRVYAGQKSAWAYGGGDNGDLLACGATYPDGYSLGSMMAKPMPVNLNYVAKGEFSAKVWTNLAPDDEVCLKVAVLEAGNCETGWLSNYYGACRTGVTNGWEDLTLDLANVPTLGNVLGKQVCIGVVFQANTGDSRPEGAYVDDVTMRLCPEGLTALCAGPAGTAPATPTPLVAGIIGGYPERISEAALAVDADGHVHALWTGKLNDDFDTYTFYSSSSDGITWTPYQTLSYWGGREPQIAVDNVHKRVHLAYGNQDGIIHRTVVNGVVSAPTVVAPQREYYLPGFSLPSGGVAWPSLTVAAETGYAYLVWEEGYYVELDTSYQFRHRSWHAYWDGDAANGGAWSAPIQKINDQDTFYSTIAAAPDGQTMLAWFPRWTQSSSGGIGPGDPTVARTAYGSEPGSFPLRQATHALYSEPQRDESIRLTYSGSDDSFVLVSEHFMYPAYSHVYRYVWKDGVWSDWLDVAGNTSGWGVPFYVGAATDTPLIRYIYTDNWMLKTRTETNGVLGPAETIADYLSARGYSGSAKAYFTDATGELHLIISGKKDGVAGFYYVKP